MYGPGDRAPRHLLGTRVVVEAHLNGDLVYAAVDSGAEQYGRVVVSLPSGRVLCVVGGATAVPAPGRRRARPAC